MIANFCTSLYNNCTFYGGLCMIITTTQLRENQKEYLDLSAKEDIYITRKGKIFAKISNPYADKMSVLHSLRGSISSKMSDKEIQDERTKNL